MKTKLLTTLGMLVLMVGISKSQTVLDKEGRTKIDDLTLTKIARKFVAASIQGETHEDIWKEVALKSGGIKGGVVTATPLPLSIGKEKEYLVLLSSTWLKMGLGSQQGGTPFSFYLFSDRGVIKCVDDVIQNQNQDQPITLLGRGEAEGGYLYFARTHPPRPVSSWVVQFGSNAKGFFFEQSNVPEGPMTDELWRDFLKQEKIQNFTDAKLLLRREITLAELISSGIPQWSQQLDPGKATEQSKMFTPTDLKSWLIKERLNDK